MKCTRVFSSGRGECVGDEYDRSGRGGYDGRMAVVEKPRARENTEWQKRVRGGEPSASIAS